MADSMDFDATPDPQDIGAALSLTIAQPYDVQNVDPSGTLLLRQSATMPDRADRAHIVRSGGDITITLVSGTPVWAWCPARDGTVAVIVTESP